VPEGRFVVTADGYRIHYHEFGAGPAVIMLHGSGPGASGWSNFKGNAATIAAAGYRVLLPDALGYGYSDKPVNTDYTLALFNRGLTGFIDALGLRSYALIGNSLGGTMALKTAIDRPREVSALVALGPGGLAEFSDYLAMPGIKAMLAAPAAAGGASAESLRAVFTLQLYDPELITDALIDERQSILQDQPAHVFRTLNIESLVTRLGDIHCPVLVFWGMNDKFCPVATHQLILDNCADSRVILLNRCGHWVQLEYQQFFNASCIAFLAEHGL
jgi:4,5:9,10-diseco-3-hydroxy-5,9,17-trioxoandrosta-1(10),2-diene-4-oate hydrolase